MTLAQLNALAPERVRSEFVRCCGSSIWVSTMTDSRPFTTVKELYNIAERIWQALSEGDWKEAFSHHPQIGDVKGLREKFAATADWAGSEQGGVEGAEESILHQLAEGNRLYESKFGYIFIVCATGKNAGEMLAMLSARLGNDAAHEIMVAGAEQAKITRLRLEKLLKEEMV